MDSTTPRGPQTKCQTYVCAIALLGALATSIIYFSSSRDGTEAQLSRSSPGATPSAVSGQHVAPNRGAFNHDSRTANARLLANYGRLPLAFEANHGQTDSRVKFLSRGRGYTMFLTGDEAVLSLRSGEFTSPLSLRCQDSGARSQERRTKDRGLRTIFNLQSTIPQPLAPSP